MQCNAILEQFREEGEFILGKLMPENQFEYGHISTFSIFP